MNEFQKEALALARLVAVVVAVSTLGSAIANAVAYVLASKQAEQSQVCE